jgi:hypothetical protein
MIFSEWNWDEALEVAHEEGREDGSEDTRQYVLEMINQGLTIEEIKQRLSQKEEVLIK